jgi:hypothetical protein
MTHDLVPLSRRVRLGHEAGRHDLVSIGHLHEGLVAVEDSGRRIRKFSQVEP